MSNQKYAIVVDPTSSGSLLAPELKTYGVESIAVHGRPLPDTLVKSHVAENFSYEFYLDGDYAELVKKLSRFELVGIFAGNEPGVKLADRLIHDFGLSGNDYELSEARTDKYEMQEAVRRAGLKAIHQFKADNTTAIVDWVKDHDCFPVIVKPVSSGGTDGVIRCTSLEMVANSCEAILNKMNLFGFHNTEAMVQEFIEGTESAVNTVSCNGQHILTEMYEYRKYIGQTGSPVYREMRYKTPANATDQSLLKYNEDVLAALGVRVGPMHSEIMLTGDGPVLIETGARMAGAFIPLHTRRCARYSQLDLSVDAVLAPDRFFEKMKIGQVFHKYASAYCLSSDQGGVVSDVPGRDEIEKLPSYIDSLWRVSEGAYLNATSDLISSPGFVYLGHEDEAQLNRDVEYIESLERNHRLVSFKTKLH